jgi:hypothetical protein
MYSIEHKKKENIWISETQPSIVLLTSLGGRGEEEEANGSS